MTQATKPGKSIENPMDKARNGAYGASVTSSWLIQRLEIPRGRAVTPFTFGAGGSGGLSKEAIDLVSPIFSFAYMGAAEYEFGSVPKALNTIAKYCGTGSGIAGELILDDEGRKVYYICSKEQQPYVEELISYLYSGKHDGAYRMRDWVGLRETLRYDSPDQLKLRKAYMTENETFEAAKRHLPLGWLELNNGFFFFADREMFEKSCRLFGVGGGQAKA